MKRQRPDGRPGCSFGKRSRSLPSAIAESDSTTVARRVHKQVERGDCGVLSRLRTRMLFRSDAPEFFGQR